MSPQATYDVHLLGMSDVSSDSRTRLLEAMAQLTGAPTDSLRRIFVTPSEPVMRGVDSSAAEQAWDALDRIGAYVELRPAAAAPAQATGPETQAGASMACPSCGHAQPAGGAECQHCGLVFAKYEREQIQKMQKDRRLEEALQKALQVREEWTQRAKHYLEGHPLPEGATSEFESELSREEIPFLRLESEEGPILMTSRRILFTTKDGTVGSLPYELISDVDVGGGLVLKRSQVRLALTFYTELPVGDGTAKSRAWQLDKDSAFYKDVVMDWVFARNFMCGACGARELDYRLEGSVPHARCMHCATDHEIDLSESIAIPQIQE